MEKEVKYCEYCGKEINVNADVCVNCGKILNRSNHNSQELKHNDKVILIIALVVGALSLLFVMIFFIYVAVSGDKEDYDDSYYDDRYEREYDDFWNDFYYDNNNSDYDIIIK